MKENHKKILSDFRKIAPNTKITINENIVKVVSLNDKGKEELIKICAYCENDNQNHYDLDIHFASWHSFKKLDLNKIEVKLK